MTSKVYLTFCVIFIVISICMFATSSFFGGIGAGCSLIASLCFYKLYKHYNALSKLKKTDKNQSVALHILINLNKQRDEIIQAINSVQTIDDFDFFKSTVDKYNELADTFFETYRIQPRYITFSDYDSKRINIIKTQHIKSVSNNSTNVTQNTEANLTAHSHKLPEISQEYSDWKEYTQHRKEFNRYRPDFCRANTKKDVSNYTVVDIETTGLSAYTNEILEIGALKVRDNEIISEFHTFIKPLEEIPDRITDINGISYDTVKDAPYAAVALQNFMDFLNDDIIIGHNISKFDAPFLYEGIYYHFEKPFSNKYIDTLMLSQKWLPELENHKLSTVSKHFGIVNEREHSAISDCKTTHLCYQKLKDEMKKA